MEEVKITFLKIFLQQARTQANKFNGFPPPSYVAKIFEFSRVFDWKIHFLLFSTQPPHNLGYSYAADWQYVASKNTFQSKAASKIKKSIFL